MRQAVDGAPAFVYNEHNNAHRAWPGTGANSPQRVQCPLRGADTEDTNVTKKKIGVLGAGTWGMALARMLCVSGNDVQVWSALPAEVENLSATRVHPNLPGMKIPEELQFTKSIEEVCTGKDVLLFAVPSVFVRSTTAKARPYIPDGQILDTKGNTLAAAFTFSHGTCTSCSEVRNQNNQLDYCSRLPGKMQAFFQKILRFFGKLP